MFFFGQVLGYVGDFVNQYAAARAFAEGLLPEPPLLRALADPQRRKPTGYERRAVSAAVPLNDLQASVLGDLSTNLEGIQGPPGTGKSTIIFHLVNSFLPLGEVALATCIQNKAVDAIAEKFAASGEIPFFARTGVALRGACAK